MSDLSIPPPLFLLTPIFAGLSIATVQGANHMLFLHQVFELTLLLIGLLYLEPSLINSTLSSPPLCWGQLIIFFVMKGILSSGSSNRSYTTPYQTKVKDLWFILVFTEQEMSEAVSFHLEVFLSSGIFMFSPILCKFFPIPLMQ